MQPPLASKKTDLAGISLGVNKGLKAKLLGGMLAGSPGWSPTGSRKVSGGGSPELQKPKVVPGIIARRRRKERSQVNKGSQIFAVSNKRSSRLSQHSKPGEMEEDQLHADMVATLNNVEFI